MQTAINSSSKMPSPLLLLFPSRLLCGRLKRQLLPWLFLQSHLISFKHERHFLLPTPPPVCLSGLHLLSGQGCHISTSRDPPGRCSALWCSHFPSSPVSTACAFSGVWLERGGRKIWGWKGLGSTNSLPWFFFFFLILLVGFNVQRHRRWGPWIWRVRMLLAAACLREYVRGD